MKKTYNIALLPGDGIGPEVCSEAVEVMQAAAQSCGFLINFQNGLIGGAAYDATGSPLPQETIDLCLAANATLLGAVGGYKWDELPKALRPETGLLGIRKAMDIFANLRPLSVEPSQAFRSTLKEEVVAGVDLMVVRELVGGIYFGEPSYKTETEGVSTMRYTVSEVERIARIAFEYAKKRKNKVTSVDKANVLMVSQLWREVVTRIHETEYPSVELEHLYVDNAAMQLVLQPKQFDVILTGNLFGDILSDVSAVLGGSLGLLPSASVNGNTGLFEPVHGSAPDIAGKDLANPTAAILSGAMLLEFLGEIEAANKIRKAIATVWAAGKATADLSPQIKLSTREFGEAVVAQFKA